MTKLVVFPVLYDRVRFPILLYMASSEFGGSDEIQMGVMYRNADKARLQMEAINKYGMDKENAEIYAILASFYDHANALITL